MTKRTKTIHKVAQLSENADKILVWTTAYKAYGNLYKDETHTDDELLTLTNAVLCNHFEKCSCEGKEPLKWLNIFEDEIISFSLLKD